MSRAELDFFLSTTVAIAYAAIGAAIPSWPMVVIGAGAVVVLCSMAICKAIRDASKQ